MQNAVAFKNNFVVWLLRGAVLGAIFLALSNGSFAQPAGIQRIFAGLDTLQKYLPPEKIYLHTDKPYYTAGDTIWLKGYLFNAAFLSPSQKSGIVYIELADDSNNVEAKLVLPVAGGLCRGMLPIAKNGLQDGVYRLRAYTSWMRNFGQADVFEKELYISQTPKNQWLVATNINTSKAPDGDLLAIRLGFTSIGNAPRALQDFQLKIFEGRKVVATDEQQTNAAGWLQTNFLLPTKRELKNLRLMAVPRQKEPDASDIVFPLHLNRPSLIDLQFLPEGGQLVGGIESLVGIKAVSEDGHGVNVAGEISDSRGAVVASFQSLHKGMGAFKLKPKPGERYTARLILPDSSAKDYPLPEVMQHGTAIAIENPLDGDSLQVRIQAIEGTTATTSPFYLVAQSAGIVCYAAVVRPQPSAILSIAKAAFPTGVAHISLLNTNGQPLNERQVFVNHHDALGIHFYTDKETYAGHDSVSIQIQVKDKDGQPIAESFSVAVTDNAQVKPDSARNMVSYLLLSSHLKGEVEEPAYYFRPGAANWRDLDNLLLTQGWTHYDWNLASTTPPVPKFEAEPSFMVSGKVTNVLNLPVARTAVQLTSVRPIIFAETKTNEKGQFVFTDLPALDTAAFLIQALNKRGKDFNVGIEMDNQVLMVFKQPAGKNLPWFVNTDTGLLKTMRSKNKILQAAASDASELQQVIIRVC